MTPYILVLPDGKETAIYYDIEPPYIGQTIGLAFWTITITKIEKNKIFTELTNRQFEDAKCP